MNSVIGTVLLAAAILLFQPAGPARAEDGRIKTHDGYELAYEKVGDGRQIVIVPGRLFLADALRALASPARTMIFYDMRNRGKSERIADVSNISIENDVRDLESVRRHFKADRIVTIGYSYLGLMVMLYAMNHPEQVERIAQLGPVPLKYGTAYPPELDNTKDRSVFDGEKWEELQRLEKDGTIAKRPREFCEKDWEFMRVMLVAAPPKNIDRLQSPCAMENEWPVHVRKHFQTLFSQSIARLDVSPGRVAARVTMPVLTVHGMKDRNAPYGAGREWAQRLANARLLTLQHAAHNSWADEPEIVLSALKAFLDGGWPSAAERVSK